MGYGTKLLLIGLTAFTLMIAAAIVWGVAYDRQSTGQQASRRIADKWSGPLSVGALYLNMPDSTNAYPATFECSVNLQSKLLHRGIYEAQVFSAGIMLSGYFDEINPTPDSTNKLILDIDPQQIIQLESISINGNPYQWHEEKYSIAIEIPYTEIENADGKIAFAIKLKAKGTENISIAQSGRKSTTFMEGNTGNPSFGTQPLTDGSHYIIVEDTTQNNKCLLPLPTERSVTDNNFTARWQQHSNDSEPLVTASASFLVGIDRYQKVTRSIKYAFIIIILTFLSVFFAEVITRHQIPLLNYMLIGAALLLFYSLLLSLSEHMQFGGAYLISSIMTVSLITAYMWGMLHSRSVAITICSILTVMYTSCYILMCVSTYALLLGSLLLFAALAATMYASLKIKF